jgi:hypothetical protein
MVSRLLTTVTYTHQHVGYTVISETHIITPVSSTINNNGAIPMSTILHYHGLPSPLVVPSMHMLMNNLDITMSPISPFAESTIPPLPMSTITNNHYIILIMRVPSMHVLVDYLLIPMVSVVAVLDVNDLIIMVVRVTSVNMSDVEIIVVTMSIVVVVVFPRVPGDNIHKITVLSKSVLLNTVAYKLTRCLSRSPSRLTLINWTFSSVPTQALDTCTHIILRLPPWSSSTQPPLPAPLISIPFPLDLPLQPLRNLRRTTLLLSLLVALPMLDLTSYNSLLQYTVSPKHNRIFQLLTCNFIA